MKRDIPTSGFPIQNLRGSLPAVNIDPEVDAEAISISFLENFPGLDTHLAEGALWRDIYALTSTFRTFYGSNTISAAWRKLCTDHDPREFSIIPRSAHVMRLGPDCSWVEAGFTFKTTSHPCRSCSGILKLIPESENWKLWCLITTLEGIEGIRNVDVIEPDTNLQLIQDTNGLSLPNDSVDCVIIGAGQSGLSVAGRLKALGVSSVVLERNARVGDNWFLRYKSLALHTPIYYSQLPFGNVFGPDVPYLMSGEDYGKGLQQFAKIHGIDVRTSTYVSSAQWNNENQTWTIHSTTDGKQLLLKARHLVLAIGNGSQIPNVPQIPGQDTFQGIAIHSKDYNSSTEWKGKRGAIIGAANTAHDIADDMLQASLESVTMVQRNPIPVVRIEWLGGVFKELYNETMPTEIADRIFMSSPIAIQRLMSIRGSRAYATEHPEYFEGLEKVGYKVIRDFDIGDTLYNKQGGHHLDVGVGTKIVQGLIKVKSDSSISHFTSTGLAFENGTTLDADIVIFATGFKNNMRQRAADIVGEGIAETLEEWYGLDQEGEPRGTWRSTGHPGLWYAGGDTAHARFFSRFLALRLKADLMGMPFEEYLESP